MLSAKDTKPREVLEETWNRMWDRYSGSMQKIYNIAKAPGFAVEGLTKYDAINRVIRSVVSYPHYREFLTIWRDRLLSTTQADPAPMLTPTNNITRQIVVCKQC